jgi:uncharacterized protein (TIGR02452 family)
LFTYDFLSKTPVFRSLKYRYNDNLYLPQLLNKCFVEVMPKDVLEVAEQMTEWRYSTLVLNEGDAANPGGPELATVEGDIMMKSNITRTLNTQTGLYPIRGEEAILSPKVCVFRDSKFKILPKPFTASFGTVAPIKNPTLNNNNRFMYNDEKLTTKKIESFFQLGIINKFECLVIQSFCTTNSPVDQIIDIFNNMINKYGAYFKFMVFAIPDNETYEQFNEHISRPQKIYLEETALLKHHEDISMNNQDDQEEVAGGELYQLANQLNFNHNNKINSNNYI